MIADTLDASDATFRPASLGPAGMDILVINLDRSPDRLAFMAAQLGRLGLAFTRLPAVDGATIPGEEFDRLSRTYMRPLSRSELGCQLSHASAWARCVETNRPAMILEDDAFLSDRLPEFLSALAHIGSLGILNLETRGREKWVSREPAPFDMKGDVKLYRLYIDRGGSAGYIVWPDAAQRLLDRSRDYAAPSDAFIDLSGIARFQSEPGLVTPFPDCPVEKRLAPAFRSTVLKPSKAARRLLMLRPHFMLRRLVGYISMTARKIRTIGISAHRRIDVCSTIRAHADNWRS